METDTGEATFQFKDFKGKKGWFLITEMNSWTILLEARLDHVVSSGFF